MSNCRALLAESGWPASESGWPTLAPRPPKGGEPPAGSDCRALLAESGCRPRRGPTFVDFRFGPRPRGLFFFCSPKKRTKKRALLSAFGGLRGKRLRFMGFTALNTDRCVSPASQAVDPIRRSRSSNGTGVSHGLRAAEGNSETSH